MTKLSKWKGADLVTSSYIFPRLFPIDHRFNSMKNEQVSLSLSLSRYFSRSKPERIHFSFFLSCLRWQSVSSWLLSSPSYVTRCHESSYTSFLLPIGTLSNKHRISCYTPRCPRVFSINFIVFASLLREGIETLPDYYFVNFVLFTIGDVYTVYSELNFSRILKLFNLSNLLKSTKKFSTYRFKEYRLETLDIPLDIPLWYNRKESSRVKIKERSFPRISSYSRNLDRWSKRSFVIAS